MDICRLRARTACTLHCHRVLFLANTVAGRGLNDAGLSVRYLRFFFLPFIPAGMTSLLVGSTLPPVLAD